MAVAQVVVRVLDGPAVVDDSIRRPIRLTPDGYAGVAYAGAVYPLAQGNTIDVSGASREIDECDGFLIAGVEVPYAPVSIDDSPPGFRGFDGEWTVDSNRFGHYVAFSAPERVARGVVDALEASGLAVQRWDVSHRPAEDGRFYDWFARLRFKGTHDECVVLVQEALAPSPIRIPPAATSPETKRVEDLDARIESLVAQVAALQTRVRDAEIELASLNRRLASSAASEADLTAALDRALAQQRTMHAELADIRQAATRQEPALLDTLARLTETEGILELALAENSTLQQTISDLRGGAEVDATRLANLESTVVELQGQLEEVGEIEREHRRTADTRTAPRRGVLGFLDGAFSRIEFVFDSTEVIANLEAPSTVLRVLVQIDMGQLIGTDLESARGWFEVKKLATGISGSEDMGRVYYKPGGARVLVCVHIKRDNKEQDRLIRRLKQL